MTQIEWKKAYIDKLIDELNPIGNTLEVGSGYASLRIQTYHPNSHTIIEKEAAKEAQEFAEEHESVTVIADSWENALGDLGTFDAIFYNDYPWDSEIEWMNREHPEEVSALATNLKEIMNTLQEALSDVSVQYSDPDIDAFYEKEGKHFEEELPRFFTNLKEKGHITEEQYQRILSKYQLEEPEPIPPQPDDNLFAFIKACTKNHMKKGSRLCCYCIDTKSKFEDPQFFDQIITNPDFDYSEELAEITVPDCPYKEGLVMIIEKLV